jgi:hypothetical protein
MTDEEITRREATKKMGRYAALTALGTFMILTPKSAQAQSPGGNGNGWGSGGNGNGNNGNGNGNGGF